SVSVVAAPSRAAMVYPVMVAPSGFGLAWEEHAGAAADTTAIAASSRSRASSPAVRRGAR
ncbi:MAG: hypothetical protein ACRDUV_22970, partial [Pseudonocardiaceae bacterium]